MKHFLFLYPISYYIDLEITRGFLGLGGKVSSINDYIDYRYRKKGFAINWLTFNSYQEEERFFPKIKIHPEIKILQSDRIIKNGINYRDFCSCDENYPNPNNIINQLPELTQLVLAGFHREDCVKRIKENALERGIDVSIDRDLTEEFFRIMPKTKIPLNRRGISINHMKIFARRYIPELLDNL